MASNYPPGVSGPIEEVVDYCVVDLKKSLGTVDDVAAQLDDQGYLPDSLHSEFIGIQKDLQTLIDSVQALVPEEPGL